MSTLNPERWRAVSPYLEQALAMPEDERTAWLASLREQNPDVAADLQTLLDEHRALVQERDAREWSWSFNRGGHDFSRAGGTCVEKSGFSH